MVLLAVQVGATNEIKWSKGCIVDTKGHVIGGEISQQASDLILFRSNDKVMVYNPHHIKSFSYYDEELKISRKFNSTKELVRKTPVFYELIMRGNVNIIRAERNKNLLSLSSVKYEYLIGWENKLIDFSDFKKDVYPVLIEQCPLLEGFTSEQRLSLTQISDVIQIIGMFNKLTAPVDLDGSYSIVTR